MSRDADGFVSRWSRLKREAEAAPKENPAPDPAPDAPPDPAAVQAAADAAAAEKTDAEILEELDLPDPDGMKMGDDFSAFMSSAVPTRLRNRALRRLWRSNPVLANLDQLNDYDGDFTDAAAAGQVVTTAYKVGRGFARRAAELVGEGDGESPGPEAPEDAPAAEEQAPPELTAEAEAPVEDRPARPRRTMRFTIDDESA